MRSELEYPTEIDKLSNSEIRQRPLTDRCYKRTLRYLTQKSNNHMFLLPLIFSGINQLGKQRDFGEPLLELGSVSVVASHWILDADMISTYSRKYREFEVIGSSRSQ